MTLLAEQAASGWLPIVILLVSITIVLLALRRWVRHRARVGRVELADAHRHAPASTDVGAASSIHDPSGYSWEAMVMALALEPEDDGPTSHDQPGNDAYYAEMLGLKADLVSGGQGVIRPNVLWGSRPLGQVFVRSGPDERAEALQIASDRHWRHLTVLRVDAPDFELQSHRGVFRPSETTPSAIRELISALRPDQTVWHQSFIAAGPKGIVASRPSADPLAGSWVDPLAGSWVYDLWLCERIAQLLRLYQLPKVQLGTRWKVPYNLGRKLTSTAT